MQHGYSRGKTVKKVLELGAADLKGIAQGRIRNLIQLPELQ